MNARRNISNEIAKESPIVRHETPSVSGTRPWHIDKQRFRKEKLDKIATEIMANEAMKLITEAYEVVFEGNNQEQAT